MLMETRGGGAAMPLAVHTVVQIKTGDPPAAYTLRHDTTRLRRAGRRTSY